MSEPVCTPSLIEALVPGVRYRIEVNDSDYGYVGRFEAVFQFVAHGVDRDGKCYVQSAEFDTASLGVDGAWTFWPLETCVECGQHFLGGDGNVCLDCLGRMLSLDDGR